MGIKTIRNSFLFVLVLLLILPTFGAVTAYKHWNDGLGDWDQSLSSNYEWTDYIDTGGAITHLPDGNGNFPAGNSAFQGCVEFTPPAVIYHRDYYDVVWNNTKGTIECWIAPRWNGENQGGSHPNGALQDVIIGDGSTNGEWQPLGQGFSLFFHDNGGALTPGYQMFVVFVDNDGSNAWQNYEVGNTIDWVAGEWHHVCISWDEYEVMAGIDGVVLGKKARNGGFNLKDDGYLFGMYSAAGPINCWDGWADDLVIHNSAIYTGLGEVGDSFTVPIKPFGLSVNLTDYDYDDNGIMNLRDFAYLVNLWLEPNQPPVHDISGDNIIGMEELSDFILYWLERSTIYISDLDQSLPSSALSTLREQDKWQLIPYQTTNQFEGTMVGAPSYINAPDLTIPLNLSGWYAIYVGYWNFESHWDGDSMIKIKLSDEAAFRQINEPQAPHYNFSATYLFEAFVDYADVTNQDLVLGKSNGLTGKKTYLAYIKLVPLSDQEVQQIQQDRADPSTRKVIAAIDGFSYFQNSEYQSQQDILELVELYRNSDVSKVFWGTSSGYRTNYQSSIVGSSWIGRDHSNIALIRDQDLNLSVLDDRHRFESLRAFQASGTLPQDIVASHVHSMGLDFDLMFGMGMNGSFPGFPGWDPNSILSLHPEYSQITRSGQTVQKASFAFSQVRQFMIDLIEEAITNFDADGVNLNFVHGPRFIQYEQPFLDKFQLWYGEDARNVLPTDPRLQIVRSTFMTEFVQNVRDMLDLVEVQKGKDLTLSVWVWPKQENLAPGGTPDWEGLDVEDWIFNNLIDAVICEGSIDTDYLSWCNSQGLDYVYSKRAMGVVDVRQAYSAGVDNFAYWNIDTAQMNAEFWPWIRKLGHQSEIADWNNSPFEITINMLSTVGGIDVVDEGIAGAVYSGG